MPARGDLIAVVEACYDLAATETEWLQGVADPFAQVLQPGGGLLACHVDTSRDVPSIHTLVQSGALPVDMKAKIESMAVLRGALEEPADRLLLSEYQRFSPNGMNMLGAPVQDIFALMNQHVDGKSATAILGGLRKKRTLSKSERASYLMLGTHIKAGVRLRRRLSVKPAGRSIEVPAGGAILASDGEVLHAEGQARATKARQALSRQCRWIEQARNQNSGRGEDALEVWKGLIHGEWSLVESFDVDGRRFLVAHRNPEDVRDPRGLNSLESRVVALAAKGHSDKLIAYHLGVAEGTVSASLSHALRKLNISGRIELVRQLGPRAEHDSL